MAEYKDLSKFTYEESPLPMKNVGWLGPGLGVQNSGGGVPRSAVVRLKEEARRPRSLKLGTHECEFCADSAPEGNGEIHVFGRDGVTYSAPCLVLHYVERHHYVPPREFIVALTSPESLVWDSRAETLRSLLANEEADPAWRVNALLSLPDWDDPRAEQAVVKAAEDDEISTLAGYELAVSLAVIWLRSRKVNWEIHRRLYPEAQMQVRDEFSCRRVSLDDL
ncbi:hypothetical protein ABZ547_13020 [Streptomyces sparsogenes]|uniref:DUF7919 family protein n=1 Tax=Streptomyces sparsogenes TaxID=67365 RepID=UPI0033E22698